MYEENNVTYKVGINWKDVLVKIILLILFILLLVWIFPRPNMSVFYDSVYRDNVNTMRESARNYYTVDRLPKSVGEQTSMTLKEMVDNHLLIRFTDKNGKTCDESSSKVEVTKSSDSEYTLKVVLNCGETKDYILETIGCTTVCSNGTCTTVLNNSNNANSVAQNNNNNNDGNSVNGASITNDGNNNNGGTNNGTATDNNGSGTISSNSGATEVDNTDYSNYDVKDGKFTTTVTYYQHRKAVVSTKTVYTCPEGYTKNGSKCYKNTTGATIDATPHYAPDQVVTVDAKIGQGEEKKVYTEAIKTQTGKDYTCPTGYTLNGSYCIKYTDATEKPGQTTYTCPTGYTLSGTKCTKTYDATYTPGGTSYTCDNGGTLSGTKCTITQNATATTTYTCPSGYTKNGTSCYKVYDATAKYSCPSGYTLSGSKCTKKTTSTINATVSYSCPSGYSKSGTKCTKTTTDTKSASVSYSCPSGWSRSGSTCSKSTTQSRAASASTSYGGWVNNGTKYYTSSGKSYTGDTSKLVLQGAISGASCGSPCGNKGIWYKYIYYTRSRYTNYSCPSGWSRSGSTCYKTTTDTRSATASYSCPSGYSRSGTTCSKKTTSTINATASYSCPSGYTKSGTKCTKTATDTKDASKSYTCPNGGTLSGSKCTITKDATKTTTYTCPAGYTLSGSKCTKTYNATPHQGTGAYSCPNGGTLNGKKCTITTDATAHPGQTVLTCPEGYTLNKTTNKCEYKINATETPVYSYTCPAGYTQEGTGVNTKCYKTEHITGYYCEDADATLTSDHKCVRTVKGSIDYYTCPSDYTLNGTKCTKNSVVTIDASATTKTTTSYKYTWSKNSYLAGWEFTGKTKVETQTYSAGQK